MLRSPVVEVNPIAGLALELVCKPSPSWHGHPARQRRQQARDGRDAHGRDVQATPALACLQFPADCLGDLSKGLYQLA